MVESCTVIRLPLPSKDQAYADLPATYCTLPTMVALLDPAFVTSVLSAVQWLTAPIASTMKNVASETTNTPVTIRLGSVSQLPRFRVLRIAGAAPAPADTTLRIIAIASNDTIRMLDVV